MDNIVENIQKIKKFIDTNAINLQPVIIPTQCQINRKDKNYNSIEYYCITPEQQLECTNYLKYINNIYHTTFITSKDISMKTTIDIDARIIYITGYINNSDQNLIKIDKEMNSLTHIMSKISSNQNNNDGNSNNNGNNSISMLKQHFNTMNNCEDNEFLFEQVYNSAFTLNVLLR